MDICIIYQGEYLLKLRMRLSMDFGSWLCYWDMGSASKNGLNITCFIVNSEQQFLFSIGISNGKMCVSRPLQRRSQAKGVVKVPQFKYEGNNQVHEKEYHILKLIYEDLGGRDKTHALTLENFLLFFHKNGFWGYRLFKEFDAGQSQLITEEEFIRGIVRIFKTSEDRKIELLFKFFSGDNTAEQGVPFKEFLTMLYNYPKEEIKEILNDEDFINKEIRGHLVAINTEFEGRRLESVCPNDMVNSRIKGTKFRYDDGDSGSDNLESRVGRDILKQFNSKQDHKGSMTIRLKVGNNEVEVKTASIHHIVKKFARRIFKEYNIDTRTGRLKLEDFRDWMSKHKKLYDDYYNGFHNQIWGVDCAAQKPLYLLSQAQFSSSAHVCTASVKDKNVLVLLVHSVLLVCEQGKNETPIFTICLEGLFARSIFEEEHGHGIEIAHRDGIYDNKKFFFLNENVQEVWMDHLKFYRGSSVSQLFDMGEKIGVGKFSIVYRCREKATNEEYAIKVIESIKLDEEEKAMLAHESSIMTILSHPLLVFFKESIQTKTHIYIVTELVKGKDLYELIRENQHLGELEAAYIARQIIIGVRYLHSVGVVHRDLKPQNIMIQFNEEKQEMGKIKIIDFGFANYLSTIQGYQHSLDPEVRKNVLAGTPNYIAPQLLKIAQGEPEFLCEKIDNFSIGSILYMMLSGGFAFNGNNTQEILQKTLEGSYAINDKRWKGVSQKAKNLVSSLLQSDPEERISLDQALRHEWFREFLPEDPTPFPNTPHNKSFGLAA